MVKVVYFALGAVLGLLFGGFFVAATIRSQADRLVLERAVAEQEAKVLWSLVEAQGRALGVCDQIVAKLGIEALEVKK